MRNPRRFYYFLHRVEDIFAAFYHYATQARRNRQLSIEGVVFDGLYIRRKTAAAGTPDSASDAEGQVKAAMRRYDQFVLAMNAESIAAMYTQDGELIDAGKTVARTPTSIRAFLASFDGAVRVEENVSIIESVSVTGATAIVTGTYQQKALLLSDKRSVRVQGKFEAEWSCHPDGQWLIRRMRTQPGRD